MGDCPPHHQPIHGPFCARGAPLSKCKQHSRRRGLVDSYSYQPAVPHEPPLVSSNMPPRTSIATAEPAQMISKPRQSLKRKSLSTTALEQVEALLPSSCTPGYAAPSVQGAESSSSNGRRKSTKGKGREMEGDDGKLTEEQKAALLVEVSSPAMPRLWVSSPVSSAF